MKPPSIPGCRMSGFLTKTGRCRSAVQENLRRIFLQIYRIVGNVDDAQDLTQETFIKALQRQEQIKDLERRRIGYPASPAIRLSISFAGTAA